MSLGDSYQLFCNSTSSYLLGWFHSRLTNKRRGSAEEEATTPNFEHEGCLGSWEYHPSSKVWELSPSIWERLGQAPKRDSLGFHRFAHPSNWEEFQNAIEHALETKAPVELKHRPHPDLGTTSILRSIVLAYGTGIHGTRVAGLIFEDSFLATFDIQQAVNSAGPAHLEQSATEDQGSRRRLANLVGSLPEWLYSSVGENLSLKSIETELLSALGYRSMGRLEPIRLRDIVHHEDLAAFDQHFISLDLSLSNEAVETTCRFRKSNDEWRWIRISNRVVARNSENRPERHVGSFLDVTEPLSAEAQILDKLKELRETEAKLIERQTQLENLNHQLALLATTDGLTGLYNYRAFNDKLIEEIRRARRYDTPLSLLVSDLDDFKAFNDQYGHPAGDERLRRFASLLREDSRDTDFVSRTGGEEFAIILINSDAIQAGRLAQRLVDSLNQDIGPKKLTASFGCVQLEPRDRTKEDLIQRADKCLYEAKNRGKNCAVVSASDVSEELTPRK